MASNPISTFCYNLASWMRDDPAVENSCKHSDHGFCKKAREFAEIIQDTAPPPKRTVEYNVLRFDGKKMELVAKEKCSLWGTFYQTVYYHTKHSPEIYFSNVSFYGDRNIRFTGHLSPEDLKNWMNKK
jgi:hypothetical protein